MKKIMAQKFLKQFIEFMMQQLLCNAARVRIVDNPLFVYKVSGGYAIYTKRFLDGRCFIKSHREGNTISCYKVFYFCFGIVDSDPQKHHPFRSIFMDNFFKDRHFFPAWQTPGSEEINQNRFSLIVAEVKVSA